MEKFYTIHPDGTKTQSIAQWRAQKDALASKRKEIPAPVPTVEGPAVVDIVSEGDWEVHKAGHAWKEERRTVVFTADTGISHASKRVQEQDKDFAGQSYYATWEYGADTLTATINRMIDSSD